jgi:cytochrome b
LKIILVWRWPVRLMHWGMVAAFCVAMWYRNSLLDQMMHIYAGYTMAAILCARIIYGFAARDLAAFRRFPPAPIKGAKYAFDLIRGKARNYLGHNPAGALAIYGMLLLGLATVGTGYWAFEYDNELAKTLHHHLAYTWFWLICLHLFGVLMGSLAHKEFLVWAMITGCKTRRSISEPFSLQAVGITLLIIFLHLLNLITILFGGKGFIKRK